MYRITQRKVQALIMLVLFIIIGVVLYCILIQMRKTQPWQHVRILTMDERVLVTKKYGSIAAIYRYVVIKPLHTTICGHPITIPIGFLSDGVTIAGLDEYGEAEWLTHDWLYSTHCADNDWYVSKSVADSVLSIPTRRMAVTLWAKNYWDNGIDIGPQFL